MRYALVVNIRRRQEGPTETVAQRLKRLLCIQYSTVKWLTSHEEYQLPCGLQSTLPKVTSIKLTPPEAPFLLRKGNYFAQQ